MTRVISHPTIRRAKIHIPESEAIDWAEVRKDRRIPIVLVDCPKKAAALCALGQPAIAIIGVTEAETTAWFRERGCNVIAKSRTN